MVNTCMVTRYDCMAVHRPEGGVSRLEDADNFDALMHNTNAVAVTEGAVSLRVGYGDRIYRWKQGSVLQAYVDWNSFPSIEDYFTALQALSSACKSWNDVNLGVEFQLTSDITTAVFKSVYCSRPADADRGISVFAQGFLPCDPPELRTLFVYARSYEYDAVKYMRNAFCHELGHILGLRHEDADLTETRPSQKSYLLGPRNTKSVMNSKHPKDLKIDQQDKVSMRDFYDYDKTCWAGVPIVDIDPKSHERVHSVDAEHQSFRVRRCMTW